MLVNCLHCGKEFNKAPSQIRRHPNNFCSNSCAAIVNNKKSYTRNDGVQCSVCQTNLTTTKQKKFCSSKCKNIYHQTTSQNCQKNRGINRKKLFVDKLGGKCVSCGYSANLSALSFHHKDPSQKSFPLDSRHLSNRTMESCLSELEKCELLCLNCHAELHNPDHVNGATGTWTQNQRIMPTNYDFRRDS